MDDLTRKNFKALSDGLKSERTKNENLAKKMTNLENQISQLRADMNQMNTQLIMASVSGRGSGSTS
jgi:phage shock protein A